MMRKLLGLMLLILITSVSLPASAQEAATNGTPAQARWDGQSRFTILVLGMDRRPGARDNLNARTDAIFLVSFDPIAESIGVMHIPRDMHLALTGAENSLVRVNTLLVRGESQQAGYGPTFAMETMQNNFGMYIDAYVAFDFVAFIEFIDLIGGVEVDVPYVISDPTYPDMNYGIDPLYLSSGLQRFDGRTALKYARTRHGDNDYLRGERQMQVILAVRDQLMTPGIATDLIGNLPSLFRVFDGHVYSNLSPDQLAYIGLAMLLVNPDSIRTGAVNQDYSFAYRDNFETVRVPDRALLPELFTQVFGENYWQ